VITRRKLLTATLPALVIGSTAMAGEWSERYRAQLRGEAKRRRQVRQQRREAILQMQRLAVQMARSSAGRSRDPEKDEKGRYKDGP
jgi:hypothetical protein